MQALERLRKAGFVPGISPAGGLLIEPASRLTAAQRAYIRAHKAVLLEELRAELAPEPLPPLVPAFDQDAFEERAAILEYDAGFSRDEAERRALTLMRAENLTKPSRQRLPCDPAGGFRQLIPTPFVALLPFRGLPQSPVPPEVPDL